MKRELYFNTAGVDVHNIKTLFKKEYYGNEFPYLCEIIEYKNRKFKLHIYMGNGDSICELSMLDPDGFWKFNINNKFLNTGFTPDIRYTNDAQRKNHIAMVREKFIDYINLIY